MLVSMFVLSSQRVQEIMDDDQRESGRIPRTVECELTADLGMNLWSSNLVYEDFLPLVFKCIWKLTLKPLGVCYKYIFSPDKITQITKLFHNNKGKWSLKKRLIFKQILLNSIFWNVIIEQCWEYAYWC